MANDCLITKLKGVVDNENLVKLNHLRLDLVVNPSTNMAQKGITVKNGESFEASIIGNGHFVEQDGTVIASKTIQISANTTTILYFSEGEYQLDISKQSTLIYFEVGSYYVFSGAVSITGSNLLCGLESIRGMTTMTLNGTYKLSNTPSKFHLSSTCNISSNQNYDFMNSFTPVVISLYHDPYFNGDIALFKFVVNTMTGGYVGADNAVGRIEDLVQARAALNTAGTVKMYQGYASLNGVSKPTLPYGLIIVYTAEGTAEVQSKEDSSVLATYDGSNWTYNL